MEKVIALIILGAIVLITTLFLANELTDKETDRLHAAAALADANGRARAMVIEAQGQARLDSAQALQIGILSVMPVIALIVLGLLGFVGLVLIAVLAVVFTGYLLKVREARLVENRIIVMLPEGSSYRQLGRIANREPILRESRQAGCEIVRYRGEL